jgi:hypothetical protein
MGLNPPPCGEGGRQAGGVFTRNEGPSPTPPHKGEGLNRQNFREEEIPS